MNRSRIRTSVTVSKLNSCNSNIENLANKIEAAIPGVRLPRPVVELNSGFSSIVMRDASDTVYLLGRTDSVAKNYRYEIALLPLILPHLPCAIPAPSVVAAPSKQFPGGVMAYSWLPGLPMRRVDADSDNSAQLADDLGHFLAALHQIPLSALVNLENRPSRSSVAEFEAIRVETTRELRVHLEVAEFTRLERWWDRLMADTRMQECPVVMTHQDYWHENLLVESEPLRLSGVVDWELARLGDPSTDFASLVYLNKQFVVEVTVAYQKYGGMIDENFDFRRANHNILREFGGMRYAIRTNDQAELIDSISKLRNTGVTSP